MGAGTACPAGIEATSRVEGAGGEGWAHKEEVPTAKEVHIRKEAGLKTCIFFITLNIEGFQQDRNS